jgi:hypothetical protein
MGLELPSRIIIVRSFNMRRNGSPDTLHGQSNSAELGIDCEKWGEAPRLPEIYF